MESETHPITEIFDAVNAGLASIIGDRHVVTRRQMLGGALVTDAIEFRHSDGKHYKVVVSEADGPGESIED